MQHKLLQDVSIQQNLRALRQKHRFSQEALVAQMQLKGSDLSRSSYAKIEMGIRNLKISDLVILKEIYNVGYDAFFEGLSSQNC